MALITLRAEQKAVQLHRSRQVEHDARVIARAVMAGANGRDDGPVQRQLAEVTGQARAADVDNQTIRGSERKGLVLHRSAEIQNQTQLVVGPPQACVTDLRGISTQRQGQGRTGQEHIEQHLASVHGMSQAQKRASRLTKVSSMTLVTI